MPIRLITLGLLSISLCLNPAYSDSRNPASEKFTKSTANGKEFITLTPAGNKFIETVAKKQVTGKLRLITKKEAYDWVEKFIKLSDKEAQKSPEWNSINNFYNHLMLCDQILDDLLIKNGEETQSPLKSNEQIPESRKKKLTSELEKLREKLKTDIEILVDTKSRASFKVLVDFYDKALKETLDIN